VSEASDNHKLNSSRKASDFFETLLRASSDGIVITDTAQNIVMANETFCGFWGRHCEDIVDTNLAVWLEQLDPDAIQRWAFLEKRVHIDGVCSDIEFQRATVAGTRYLSVNASLLEQTPDTESGNILSIWRDVTERVQAEVALQTSEEKLKSTMASMDDLVFVLDKAGVFLEYYQPHDRPDLYAPPEVFVGKSFRDIMPSHTVDLFDDAIKNVINSGAVQQVDYYLEMPEGTTWYSAKISIRKDSASDFAGVTVVSRDITKRKRAEEALEWELAVNGSLAELSQAMISQEFSLNDLATLVFESAKRITNSEHGFVSSIDPETKENVGHTLTQMMGSSCQVESKDQRIAFPIGDDGKYANLWGHALNTREAFYTNSPQKHKSSGGLPEGHLPLTGYLAAPALMGNELVGQIALANATDGYNKRKLAAIKRFADLYAIAVHRKRAEEDLQRTEDYFRSLIENSQDAIVVLNRDGTARYRSPSYERLLGYKPDEPVADRFERMHPDDAPERATGFDQLSQESGSFMQGEVRVKHKNGSWVYVEATANNLLDNPAVNGIVVNFRDITERKQAEVKLKEQHDAIQVHAEELTATNEQLHLIQERLLEINQQLSESEERYRMLAENAADVIWTVDMDLRFTYLSPSITKLRGCTLEEAMAQSVEETLTPDSYEVALATLKEEMEYESSGENLPLRTPLLELEQYCKDGTTVWTEMIMSLIRSPDGKPVGIQGVTRDITERRRADKALQESEARWRSLVENAPDYITIVDKNFTIRFMNHPVPGVTQEDVIGKDVFDFIQPEYHDIARKSIEHVFATGESSTYESVAMGPYGKPSWYYNRLGPIKADGQVVAVTFIGSDITEQKLSAERILQRNRELVVLNEIAETISQSIDLDEILSNTMDKTLELLNITTGAVYLNDRSTGNLFLRTYRGISEEDTQSILTIEVGKGLLGSAAQSGEPFFVESFVDARESIDEGAEPIVSKKQLNSAMFVPLKAKNNVIGAMCTFTHGERKFTEEERYLLTTIGHQASIAIEKGLLMEEASRAEALDELDKLRTELLASVSHELRTPLTVIKGLSDSLIQPDVEWDSETAQDFLWTISQESDVLSHIITNLMEMSQMEAGMMTMYRKKSDIPSIINQLEHQLNSLTSNHKFEIDISPDLSQIEVDEIRIGEVIVNLVSNAALYSEKGSRITLHASEVDGENLVTVTDQGIGIPVKATDKIFDRFYRLESGVAHRRGGTGLGLAISKGIVESHSGKIWVESNPGEGSKFSFTIPNASDSDG